jgi:ectoine hydroxylase-related dioxygenase (phytanoyl-CoA dioxygenase family)
MMAGQLARNRTMLATTFQRAGHVTLPALLDAAALQAIDVALNLPSARPRQMLALPWCAALAHTLRGQLVAAGLLPAGCVSVQCTAFEKSRAQNWLVAPHQDLSIPVAQRVDHTALTGWSEKDGMLFVQPPVAVLEQLVALRLHIDDCQAHDGALKVVPGSHLAGRVAEADKAPLRATLGEVVCPVAAGGAMAMRPLLLHASSKATGTSRRRVLHFVFGPAALPHGLAWAIPGAHNEP